MPHHAQEPPATPAPAPEAPVVGFWFAEGSAGRAALLYAVALVASLLACHCAAGGAP